MPTHTLDATQPEPQTACSPEELQQQLLEDEIDRRLFAEAMATYKKDPITYTFDEVCKMLDLE